MMNRIFVGSLVLTIGGGLLLLAWLIWDTMRPHPTIALDARDWSCTLTAERTVYQPVIIGKTTMMIPQHRTVCVRYERAE